VRSLLLLLLAVPVAAQVPAEIYDFEFRGPADVVMVENFGVQSATLYFKDLSRDSPNTLVPGAPGVRQMSHDVSFRARITSVSSEGWFIAASPSPITSYAADPPQAPVLSVLASPAASNPYLRVEVTATMRTQGGEITKSVEVLFKHKGIQGLQVRPENPVLSLAPRDVGNAKIILTNVAMYPQHVSLRVMTNPCGLEHGLQGDVVLDAVGGEAAERRVGFSVVAPDDQFYYQSDTCILSILATARDLGPGEGAQTTSPTSVIVRVSGFHVDPAWVFWTVGVALAVFLLALLLARRREMREEEVLGKPQKPWLIPVEKVYLAALKRKDPRAWYVVRHYLMEEEYRSSLLWYKSYRAATKGSLQKERLILNQEHKYEAWKAKWSKRIAKPLQEADAFEAKLQRKLDRKAKANLRKARRARRKAMKADRKSYRKAVKKAGKRHEKAVAKAARKGLPEPPMPDVPEPVAPPEPVLEPIHLADHRWAKRAARFRKRMERRAGNLEVRYEVADARYLARLRRRVQRLARKLDDPTFVAEHPLLSEG
jgi:hypothetical protein